MRVLLVRHARAGDRGDWVGDDAHRPLDGKVALLDDLGDSAPALSTHGDVIAEVVGWDAPCKKGSIWILEVDGGEIRPGTYLPPA